MPTKNTEEDIIFAQQWLSFLARRHRDAEVRARAKIILATIEMLDVRHPTWRDELLAELSRRGLTVEIDKMFPLADVDDNMMFKQFMRTIITAAKDQDHE